MSTPISERSCVPLFVVVGAWWMDIGDPTCMVVEPDPDSPTGYSVWHLDRTFWWEHPNGRLEGPVPPEVQAEWDRAEMEAIDQRLLSYAY